MKQLLFVIFMGMALSINAQDSAAVKPKGKKIDKIKIWKNGRVFDADDIKVVCAYDDFESSATLYYQLTDSTGVVVSDGNIMITGADYLDYSTKPNHANRASLFAIRYLNLQNRAAREAVKPKAVTGSTTNN